MQNTQHTTANGNPSTIADGAYRNVTENDGNYENPLASSEHASTVLDPDCGTAKPLVAPAEFAGADVSKAADIRPGEETFVDASGIERPTIAALNARHRGGRLNGGVSAEKAKDTSLTVEEIAQNAEFNKQQEQARAEKTALIKGLMAELRQACQKDGARIDTTKQQIEDLKLELSQGYTSTGDAGKTILAICYYLKEELGDTGMIKEFITKLTYKGSKGENKAVPWNKAAQNNYALPLAVHGYQGTKNKVHISRIAAVVGYAFNVLKMAPEAFPTWLFGTHEYTQGTKTVTGSGLFAAWMAISEAKALLAGKKTETPAERAAMRTNAVLVSITNRLPLATIDENQMGVEPNNGLYALIGRRTSHGTVEVLWAVPDKDCKLLPEMISRVYLQLELDDKKAKALAEQAQVLPPPSFSDLRQFGLDTLYHNNHEQAA